MLPGCLIKPSMVSSAVTVCPMSSVASKTKRFMPGPTNSDWKKLAPLSSTSTGLPLTVTYEMRFLIFGAELPNASAMPESRTRSPTPAECTGAETTIAGGCGTSSSSEIPDGEKVTCSHCPTAAVSLAKPNCSVLRALPSQNKRYSPEPPWNSCVKSMSPTMDLNEAAGAPRILPVPKLTPKKFSPGGTSSISSMFTPNEYEDTAPVASIA